MIQERIVELTSQHIPMAEVNTFVGLGKLETVGKYDYLHQQGKVMQKLFFCTKGVLAVIHQQEGRELVKQFVAEGSFVPVIFSLLDRLPSAVAIKSLEESQVVVWDYSLLTKLMGENPAWRSMLERMLRNNYCQKEQKETLFLETTPKERYLQLIHNRPLIANRVPLHYIASYLGVAAETLSRIRTSRIGKKKVFSP
jgi:CRP-like cAMP-binding protein